MSRLAVLLLVLTVCEKATLADDPVVSDEAKLETHLFENYDLERRPVKDHTKTVDVKVNMNLKYFTVDDITDTITIHCWMVMTWTDQFLAWTPSFYSGIQRLQVDSLKMWQPQLSLYNADITSQSSDARFASSCTVVFNGFVICVPHVSHTALCAPDPRRWPYDIQNCSLRFGSWMHSGEQINFTFGPEPVTRGDYQENREWALDSVSTFKHTGLIKSLNQTHPSLRFSFILKRRSATHAAIVLVPAISLALLTTSCGLLAPGALRLGVALTSLSVQIIYLTEISWYVPSHGDYPAYIIMFFRDSVLITTIMVIVSMAVMSVTKFTSPPPRLVSIVVTITKTGPAKFVTFGEFDPPKVMVKTGFVRGKGDAFARIAHLGTIIKMCRDESEIGFVFIIPEDGESNGRMEQERTANLEWQKFASVFNNIFFLIITLTYIILIFVYVLS